MSETGTYDSSAAHYNVARQSEALIPRAKIENEIMDCMLGDCTDLHILDIGGGTGRHARRALSLGATRVDVIDLSPGMLDVGRKIEAEAGRTAGARVEYYQGDAHRDISEQVPELPDGGYDVVMAIWATENARRPEDLQSLWQNAARYLKDGGRLVAVRASPLAEAARDGKYGIMYHGVEKVEGGVSYKYTTFTRPKFTIAASSMEVSYGGSTELLELAGFAQIQVFDPSTTQTVKDDPKFWQDFLKDPHFVAFTAVKN